MNTTLFVIVFALMALCILLMRKILKLEYAVFDLNEKLNLSDEEYVDLFNVNLELTEEVELLTEFQKIRKLTKEKTTI